MANPQKENGNTQIANEILEALIGAGLNGTELAVTLHLLRKTYGWNKKEDQISLSQFAKNIPCSKQSIVKAINVLKLVNIIILVNKGNSKICSNTYAFNKNYDTWQLVKKSRLVNKRNSTSKQNDKQLVNKPLHTKDTLTKDNIQKKDIYTDKKFNKFYQQYPLKKGKLKAYQKFISLPEKTQDMCISVLQNHIRSDQWQQDGGKYIPHPATWLGQGRWDDEITDDREYQDYGEKFQNLNHDNKQIMLRRIKNHIKGFAEKPSIKQINLWIDSEL